MDLLTAVDGALMLDSKPVKIEREPCPACDGEGTVCCATWAMVRANAGDQIEKSGIGLPLWPLNGHLEMTFCPFCGSRWERRGQGSK